MHYAELFEHMGGWSQKLGQVMLVLVSADVKEKKQMLLVKGKKPIDAKKSHKSGHKVATFADSAFCCFVFYIRSLHGIVIHF